MNMGMWLRKIGLIPPPKPIPCDEKQAQDRVRKAEHELHVLEVQNRQRDTIYLLEQEVAAVTGSRRSHRHG